MGRIDSMTSFPSEETRSREYEEAMSHELCQIWVYHLRDYDSVVLPRLKDEFENTPYINAEMSIWEQIGATDERCVLVYISDFTSDGFDLAYFLRGQACVLKFCSGTFGMQAYTGSMFITPTVTYTLEELLVGATLTNQMHDKVIKHGARLEQVRWRYLFETAKLAWGKLELDANGISRLGKVLAEIQAERAHSVDEPVENALSDDEAGAGMDWEIQSVTSMEAGEIRAEMSEKKRGKMKAPEIEEPESDNKGAGGCAGVVDGERKPMTASTLSPDDLEAERNAIREDLDKLRYSGEDISHHICRLMITKCKDTGTNVLRTRNQLSIVKGLTEVMRMFAELDEARSAAMDSGAVDLERFMEQEAQFNAEREEYIARMQAEIAHSYTAEQENVLERLALFGYQDELFRPRDPYAPDPENHEAEHDEGNQDAISEHQQDLVMRYMEFTSQGFEYAVRQLRGSGWNIEAAASRWSEMAFQTPAPEAGSSGSGSRLGGA